MQHGSSISMCDTEDFLQWITGEERNALVRSPVGIHNCQHAIWMDENISKNNPSLFLQFVTGIMVQTNLKSAYT